MSRKTRTTVSVVEKLIEQRRLFQDWLTKLSGEVDGMPAHVVERVRNDYRSRFDGVMRELGEHRDSLREALDEAQDRHDGLDRQLQGRKDELAELKLRRQVGEIDETRFKEQSTMLKTVLDGLQRDISSATRDIERYDDILAVIAADEKPPAPPQDEYEDEEEEEEDEEVEEEEEEEEEPVRAPARAAAPPPPPPRPAPPPQRPATETKKAVGDDLAFLRSITPPVGSKPAPPAPAPAAPVPAPAPAPISEMNFDAAPGLVQFDDPAPAEAAPAAAGAKKEEGLVCGECGALNRPTEWYCEKCGAELAAL
jgi:hypothetical protein